MPVNWKAPDAFERLLAAMVAAQDMKLDYRKIATFYGNGATYDSIEGRFRIIKREAATLKAEIESGSRPEAPARGNNTPTSTPKKPRSTNAAGTPKTKEKSDKTLGGRVSKPGTPSKGRKVKTESESEAEFGMDGAVDSFYSAASENLGMDGSGDWNGNGMMDHMNAVMADPFDGLDVGV